VPPRIEYVQSAGIEVEQPLQRPQYLLTAVGGSSRTGRDARDLGREVEIFGR
jgi:hypothetical protein